MPLRELLAKFGIRVDDRQAEQADKKVNSLKDNLVRLGQVLLGGALVRGAARFVSQNVQLADNIAKTSDKLGLGTQELQGWRFAAQNAGIQVTALDMGLQRFIRRAAEAKDGTGAAKDTFAELGVELTNSQGTMRPTRELLLDVADGLAGVETQSEKVKLAFKLFDSEGVNLVNLLGDGSEQARELLSQFEEMGAGFDRDAIEKSVEFSDSMLELRKVMEGFKSTILSAILPALTRASDWIGRLTSSFSELAKNSNIVQATLVTLGAVAAVVAIKMAIAFAPFLLKALLIAGAILLLVLLVDDLMTLFEGGESVIGRTIDKLLGAGTAADMVEWLKDAWEGLGPILEAVWGVAKNVLGFIFGIITDIGGAVLDRITDIGKLWEKLKEAESIKEVFAAVFEFLKGGVDDLIGLVGELVEKFLRLSDFGGEIADWLGLDSTGGGGEERAVQRGGAAGPVTQENVNIFNMHRLSDPERAAVEVQRRQRRAQRDAARDLEGAMGQGA